MSHPDLNELARRPVRYWSVDGLPELMLGILWMVWGGAWLFGQTLPHDWRWNVYWLVVPAALAASGFLVNWATRRVKARVTFPRAGYVEWNEPSRRARLGAGLVVLATAIVLAIIVLQRDAWNLPRMATPVLSVILALSFVAVSVNQRAPHYLALAAVAVALGLSLGAMTTGWDSMNWMFVVLGAACALAGSLRLTFFLRQHPRVPQEGL